MELTDKQNMVMITIFYLNKLSELGLIEGGGIKITTKGFDLAYDLYNSGYKITMDEMKTAVYEIMNKTPEDTQEQILALTYHIQKVGIEKMIKEVEEMNNKK